MHAKPQANPAKPPTLPRRLAKLASNRTTLIFNVPFGTQINRRLHAVTDVSDVTSTMFDTVHELPSGTGNVESPATGTSKDFLRSQTDVMPDWNSALTGNGPTAAPVEPTQRSIVAQDAQAVATELAATPKESETRVNTLLQVEAWKLAISKLNLSSKYPSLIESIQHGFDAGIPKIYHTFTPSNKLNEPESLAAFQGVMENEISMR